MSENVEMRNSQEIIKALDDEYDGISLKKNNVKTSILPVIFTILMALIVTLLVLFLILSIILNPFSPPTTCQNTISPIDPPTIVRNQKVPILLENIITYDGLLNGERKESQSIYFENGIIQCIGDTTTVKTTCEMSPNTTTYDLQGRVVTPGLVDVHSHTGVFSGAGPTWAYGDGNEMTNPTTPFVRAIDGFRTRDVRFNEIAEGGITTSLILPGSGNVIGGQGVVVKMKIKKEGVRTMDDILVSDQKRYLKMACGENPKRVYGRDKSQMPASRMGHAWIMREIFQKAKKLKEKQDAWDCKWGKDSSNDDEPRPNDLSLEPLVELIRGNVLAHVHCYEVVDFEMAIRVSKEFGFKITTFHHSAEAYKIPDILRENNISVAIFPVHWGSKMEAYDASVYGSKILRENGVSLIIKSDHPVTHGRELMHKAALAHHFGLDEMASIASVTSEAAKSIGLFHRLGSLEKGKDADLVIWNRHPLRNAVKPYQIYIEGNLNLENQQYSTPSGNTNPPQRGNVLEKILPVKGANILNIAIKGVKIFSQHSTHGTLARGDIVVTDGNITCLAPSCIIPTDHVIYRIPGGIVTPGFIQAASNVGNVGIPSETPTQDGPSPNGEIQAIDGIALDTRTGEALWKAGVTTSITKPQGNRVISGVSVAFHNRGILVTDNSTLIQKNVALHISIGNSAKSTQTPSVSSQIQFLREKFRSPGPGDDFIRACLSGNMTIAVHGNKADYLARVVSLRKEFPQLKFLIVGGAEAFMIKNELAGIPILLTPTAGPGTWESKRSDFGYHIDDLVKSGFTVGLSGSNDRNARELRWEAGISRDKLPNATDEQVIALITSNVADMFELGVDSGVGRIIEGTRANFALFNGDPLSFGAEIKLVVTGDKRMENPKQV